MPRLTRPPLPFASTRQPMAGGGLTPPAAEGGPSAPAAEGSARGFDAVVGDSFERVDNPIGPSRLELTSERSLPVESASGILSLGDGRFLVVDDDKGIYRLGKNGKTKRLLSSKKHKKLNDLEGITHDTTGRGALVISERTGEVMRVGFKPDDDKIDLSKPKKLGRLPKLSKRFSNNGWEGIDIMPGRFFEDGEPRLVAVHEAKPRRVGVFSYPDFQESSILKLPKAARSEAKDLSDVAVDPSTGRIFVLSDRSKSILELELKGPTRRFPQERASLSLVGVTDVPTRKGAKPEALDSTLR